MAHLKRLAAPRTWPIQRKRSKYIAKPLPGPHTLGESLPLSVVLIETLGIAHRQREVRAMLQRGNILVNHVARKDGHFPVGLFDALSIPELQRNYLVLFNTRGKISFLPVAADATRNQYLKIINKTTLPKKKLQLNFFNGMNLLVDKDTYHVGDTVLMHEGKIVKHLPLEKGALVYLTGGKHVGTFGTIEEIKAFKGSEPDKIIIIHNNEQMQTLKQYAFVVEKEFHASHANHTD